MGLSGKLLFALRVAALSLIATKALEHQPAAHFDLPRHAVPAALRSGDYVPVDPREPEEPRFSGTDEESLPAEEPHPGVDDRVPKVHVWDLTPTPQGVAMICPVLHVLLCRFARRVLWLLPHW